MPHIHVGALGRRPLAEEEWSTSRPSGGGARHPRRTQQQQPSSSSPPFFSAPFLPEGGSCPFSFEALSHIHHQVVVEVPLTLVRFSLADGWMRPVGHHQVAAIAPLFWSIKNRRCVITALACCVPGSAARSRRALAGYCPPLFANALGATPQYTHSSTHRLPRGAAGDVDANPAFCLPAAIHNTAGPALSARYNSRIQRLFVYTYKAAAAVVANLQIRDRSTLRQTVSRPLDPARGETTLMVTAIQ